jgi:hypothetical protein
MTKKTTTTSAATRPACIVIDDVAPMSYSDWLFGSHAWYIPTIVELTFDDFKDLLSRCGCDFTKDKSLTIPGNREAKLGHLRTMLEKDLPTLEAYDFRRGTLEINPTVNKCDHWQIINHGHRTRALWTLFTKDPTGKVTLKIAFTDSVAEGYDGTQANWTNKDAALSELMKQEEFRDSKEGRKLAVKFANYQDQGGKAIRCRIQGLSVEGGGQTAHRYNGKTLNAIQETQLWNFCPLHLATWNLLTCRSKDGSTILELLGTEFTKDYKNLAKYRLDLIAIALLDHYGTPKLIEELNKGGTPKQIETFLDKLKTDHAKIGKPFHAVYDSLTTEGRYKAWIHLAKCFDEGTTPTTESILAQESEPFSGVLPQLAKTLKTELDSALANV